MMNCGGDDDDVLGQSGNWQLFLLLVKLMIVMNQVTLLVSEM